MPFRSICTDSDGRITIECIETVSKVILKRALIFMYTGAIVIDDKSDQVAETMELAEFLELDYLQNACNNIVNDMSELNPSIETFCTDATTEELRKNYFLKPDSTDISFRVLDPENGEEEIFSAHKCIVTARCEPLRRMMENELFSESSMREVPITETSPAAFREFLYFLYTEHTELLADSDDILIDVLQLANFYGADRLVSLSELYISKLIERATVNDIIKQEDVDLVALLNLASRLNAKQLEAFLRHFFSVNYFAVSQRSDFKSLSKDNLNFVEENQWPPVSYFKQVEKFEKDHAIWKKKNKIEAKSSDGFFGRLFASSAK